MSVFDRPLMTKKEIARMLGRRPGWLHQHMADLQARGFPQPVIGKLYDPRAVHAWLDALMDPALLARIKERAA